MVLWLYLFFPWKKLHNFIMETKITIFCDFVSQYAIIASLFLQKRSMHSPWSIVLNIMNPIYTYYQKDNETTQKWLQFSDKMTSLEKGNMEHLSQKILAEKNNIFQFVQIVIKRRNLIDWLTKNIYKLVNYKMWKNVLWLYCMMQCIFIECVSKYFFLFNICESVY